MSSGGHQLIVAFITNIAPAPPKKIVGYNFVTEASRVVYNNTAFIVRLRLKCDGTRAETRFRLSAKRTSPFKSAGASVQSTTGSRGVRMSGSNA